jgi:hypothetical protein
MLPAPLLHGGWQSRWRKARQGKKAREGPRLHQRSQHAGTYGCQLVKTGKELVEQLYKLLGTAGRGQLGEAHYVGEEDAVRVRNHRP